MRCILIFLLCLSFPVASFAIEVPHQVAPRRLSLLSGGLLRDDIDKQRTFHYQQGIEYSQQLTSLVSLAGIYTFNWDNNWQARKSSLTEDLYAFHVLASLSFNYLLRFSLGAGPSLRYALSSQRIGEKEIYRTSQVGLGYILRFTADYSIDPHWEVSYGLGLENRLPEPRTVWRQDIAHMLGLGYRF